MISSICRHVPFAFSIWVWNDPSSPAERMALPPKATTAIGRDMERLLVLGADGGDNVVAEAAEVDRDSVLGVLDLAARLDFAAQLSRQLDDLRDAGRAHRVALGLEPTRWVDGQPPGDGGRALAHREVRLAAFEQAQFLTDRQLEHDERVMKLCEGNVLGAYARH